MLRYWDGTKWTDAVSPEAQPPPPPAPAKKSPRRLFSNRTAIIATVLTLAVIAGWFFLGYNSGENRAIRACKEGVELRLKTPSTAEYSDMIATRDQQTNQYDVTGYVDAENGFGAKVRESLECTVDGSIATDVQLSED